METQEFLQTLYHSESYQQTRYDQIATWSLEQISLLTYRGIARIHPRTLGKLTYLQKNAFTEAQKSYMNADQLAALSV